MSSYPLLALWAFAAGVGVPLIGLLNGGLARALGSAASAAVVAFVVGLVATLAIGIASGHLPSPAAVAAAPRRTLAAGFFVAFYVVSATYLIPRFGVGNTILFVIAAQVVASATIDHFGLLGAARRPVDALRLAGIALLLAGLVITQLSVMRVARAG